MEGKRRGNLLQGVRGIDAHATLNDDSVLLSSSSFIDTSKSST